MFGMKHRFQEANLDPNKGGGGGGGEWLKPFGEHAKVFEGIKDPAELATRWTELKAKPTTFDWRKELAGDDATAQQALGRFTDPKLFTKAFLEAQNKIRSGELAKPLAKDAKPEEIAAWRAANGIPADPKDYWKELPNGLAIGKDDQPVFDAYGAIAHKHNAPPALMQEFAQAYYEQQAAVAKAERAVDQQDAVKTTEVLKAKWGNEYDVNMNILDSHLDGLPADLKAMFKDATLGDGTRLFNSPEVMQFLVATARAANPLAHLLPAGGEGNLASLDSELAGLKKMMADKSSEYWKGPKSAANQARYRQLVAIDAQVKRKTA